MGLVAGRWVGGAVVRNRAKRRLRAVLDAAELADSFDYVVIASPGVATAPFGTVTDWVWEAIADAVATAADEETA